MTSDGSYPPGYEPADTGAPYGRPPGDEQYPTQPPYGIERPATANYASMGSERPWQPSGGQPDRPTQGGWPRSEAGYGPAVGSASVPRPPEPAHVPDQGRPADPSRVGGVFSGRASVGNAPSGRASVENTSMGSTSMGAAPVSPGAPGVYGTPTQYGSGQYGAPATAQLSGATALAAPGQLDGARYGGGLATELGQDANRERQGGGSRRKLIIGLALAGVVIIALVAVAAVASTSGNKANGYAVGSCVKQSGDAAATSACSEAGAYRIVSRTNSPTKCADQAQPYVILRGLSSADDVLCLKPAR